MASSNNVKTEVKKEEKAVEVKQSATTPTAKETVKVEAEKEAASKVEATAKKTEEIVEEPKKEVAAKKATAAKKDAEPKKTTAKRTTTAKKTTTKKAATAKNEEEKESTAKKTTTRRTAKAVEPNFVLQYQHIELNEEELVARFKEQWAAMGNSEKDIKEMTVYLKPEEYSAYFVINGVDTIQIYL